MIQIDTQYIQQLFPFVSTTQLEQFEALAPLYYEWNSKINVISRKDIDNLFIHHVLHSLAIAKVISFNRGAKILDVGTGGGFPGIPLAILFPEVSFHLIDRIAKKIRVVNEVKNALNLQNVLAEQKPCEEIKDKYDFVVSRAVTSMVDFYRLAFKHISPISKHKINNGILYLKGDNVAEEIGKVKLDYQVFNIKDFFQDEFFDSKCVVYIPKKK